MTDELTKRLVDLRGKLPVHETKRYKTRALSSITSLSIHHSLTTGGDAVSFADYHVRKNNWPGIGYSYVIKKDGIIQWCWDLNILTYHVGDSNKQAVGICLVGDFRIEKTTDEQLESLYYLMDFLIDYLPNNLQIKGHSDYPSYNWKECPAIDIDELISNYEAWKELSDMQLLERVERLEKEVFGKVYTPPVVINEYKKLRFKNLDGVRETDVHIYMTNNVPELVLGEYRKREYLDQLAQFYGSNVAINAGFFSTADSTNEQLGLLVTNNGTGADVGGWYQSSDPKFLDLIAWKDGSVSMEIKDGYDGKYISNIQKNAYWGLGTSYALIQDGKKSNLNWEKHKELTNQFVNRSMIGQNNEGIWYLIVADGRTAYDKGLNAEEQVKLGLDLGLNWLVNLDGDKSSEMYKDGKIVTSNLTVDRPIGTAFIVRTL